MHIFLTDKHQRWLFAIVVGITVFFLLYPSYLPMIDLSQHAAQVATLNDLIRNNSPWQHMVFMNWDIPYLITYLTWLALYQVMSITASAKIIVCGIFLFYIYAIRQLRHAFQAERLVDWIALTTFFGFTFQWGFVSFLLSMPIGIMFFLACKRWLEQHQRMDLVKIFIWGIALYFSHILGFAFFCFLAYLYFLINFKQQTMQQRLAFTAPFLLFAIMFARIALQPKLNHIKFYSDKIEQYSILWKTEDLLYMPWNMAFLDYYDLAYNSLYILPFLCGYRLILNKNRYILFVGILLVWYILPHHMLQTTFWYERFALLIPVFYYLLFTKGNLKHQWQLNIAQLASIALILCLSVAMYKTYSNHWKFEHSVSLQQFQAAKQTMLPEKRVMALFDDYARHEGSLTSNREYIHFVQWYQAEKRGWVDFSFATAPAMIVRMKNEAIYPNYSQNRGATQPNLESGLDCAPYDYLVMRLVDNSIENAVNWLKKNPQCQNMTLQSTHDNWFIFAKKATQP